MPKKEREAKNAAFKMNKELDSEMTEEERERKEKSGMGLFGGVNKGEEELFAKKETKEEKKAKAEAKRLEMAAKKAAKKAAGGESTDGDTSEGGMSRTDSAVDISEMAIDPEAAKRVPLTGVKNKKGKGGKKGAEEEVIEDAESGGGLQKLDEGTLKFAVCTGVLASVRLGLEATPRWRDVERREGVLACVGPEWRLRERRNVTLRVLIGTLAMPVWAAPLSTSTPFWHHTLLAPRSGPLLSPAVCAPRPLSSLRSARTPRTSRSSPSRSLSLGSSFLRTKPSRCVHANIDTPGIPGLSLSILPRPALACRLLSSGGLDLSRLVGSCSCVQCSPARSVDRVSLLSSPTATATA